MIFQVCLYTLTAVSVILAGIFLAQRRHLDTGGSKRLAVLYALLLTVAPTLTVIGVIVLYVAVGQWNSYMDCLIYIQDTAKMSLQVILRRIMTLAQTAALMDEAGDYAAAMADREARNPDPFAPA